jgi:hypothetical protein
MKASLLCVLADLGTCKKQLGWAITRLTSCPSRRRVITSRPQIPKSSMSAPGTTWEHIASVQNQCPRSIMGSSGTHHLQIIHRRNDSLNIASGTAGAVDMDVRFRIGPRSALHPQGWLRWLLLDVRQCRCLHRKIHRK